MTKKNHAGRPWEFNINNSSTTDLQLTAGDEKLDGKGDNRPGLQALGYTSKSVVLDQVDQEGGSVDKTQLDTLERVAWSTARAPASQLFMTGFMLWMSGAGVHIFSIMITGMALLNPLKAIANTGEVFKRFKAPRGARLNLLPMKLTYIAIQLVAFSMGIWKINKMGLLPLTSADWSASMLQLRNFQETSVHITNDL